MKSPLKVKTYNIKLTSCIECYSSRCVKGSVGLDCRVFQYCLERWPCLRSPGWEQQWTDSSVYLQWTLTHSERKSWSDLSASISGCLLWRGFPPFSGTAGGLWTTSRVPLCPNAAHHQTHAVRTLKQHSSWTDGKDWGDFQFINDTPLPRLTVWLCPTGNTDTHLIT